MEKVSCPWCRKAMYSAFWGPGKVKCIHCGGVFFIGYDEIRQLWIATDPKSPIQSMMIRKAKGNEQNKKGGKLPATEGLPENKETYIVKFSRN